MNITVYTDETRKELTMIGALALALEETIISARFDLDQLAYANARGYCSYCNTNHAIAAQKKVARAVGYFKQIQAIMECEQEDDTSSSTHKQDVA